MVRTEETFKPERVREYEENEKKRKERYVTENEFLNQMMAESHRCTDAMMNSRTALIWNAINTVLIVSVVIASALLR